MAPEDARPAGLPRDVLVLDGHHAGHAVAATGSGDVLGRLLQHGVEVGRHPLQRLGTEHRLAHLDLVDRPHLDRLGVGPGDGGHRGRGAADLGHETGGEGPGPGGEGDAQRAHPQGAGRAGDEQRVAADRVLQQGVREPGQAQRQQRQQQPPEQARVPAQRARGEQQDRPVPQVPAVGQATERAQRGRAQQGADPRCCRRAGGQDRGGAQDGQQGGGPGERGPLVQQQRRATMLTRPSAAARSRTWPGSLVAAGAARASRAPTPSSQPRLHGWKYASGWLCAVCQTPQAKEAATATAVTDTSAVWCVPGPRGSPAGRHGGRRAGRAPPRRATPGRTAPRRRGTSSAGTATRRRRRGSRPRRARAGGSWRTARSTPRRG
jgi:hypothetical protein